MIFVTLGTQKQDFSRLLKYIEESNLKDEIIVQAGYTKFNSNKMKIFDFIDYEDMEKYIEKADLIITHAGTGSVLTPLKLGKKVIVCSRLSKYGEHVDDHQKQLTEVLKEAGYVLELNENNKLDDLITEMVDFKPKKYISNNEEFIKKLKNEIENKFSKKDSIFFIIILLILSLGFLTLIRTPKDLTMVENRTLTKLQPFTLSNFISGSFQDNLEDTLSDQFIGGETIKKYMLMAQNSVNALYTSKSLCNNEYVSLGHGFYTFDCGDYIVNMPSKIDFANTWYVNDRIAEFNKVNQSIDAYYYVINRSFNFDFRSNTITSDLTGYLKERLTNYKGLSELKIDSYDTYKKYFYKTDHHWNSKGSYQGYKDIVNMLGFFPMQPVRYVNFENTTFYGSSAKDLSFYDIKEQFSAYEFEFSNHIEYINGSAMHYGNYDKYFKGIYSTSSLNPYYGDFYGNDNGEVMFNYSDNSKDNILILSSSFANPIKPLIASHFNRTYSVDMRDYKDFDIYDYIKKNNINKVLFIMDINFIIDSSFELGV